MSTTPTPQTLPVPARRRRRWLRVLAIVLAGTVVLVAGLLWYADYAVKQAWQEAEAEADRTDPDWRMSKLFLARRAVPDAENSALILTRIADKKKDFHVQAAPKYRDLFDHLQPIVAMNASQTALLRTELAKIGPPLEEARQLHQYPYGRFPIKLGAAYYATTLPDHHKPRQIADWLKHDAWLRAHERDIDGAIASCRACLCAARSMGDEPLIIAHFIRTAVQTETIIALERVLAQGVADEKELLRMQTLLELESRESTFLHAIRGERAGVHLLFEDFRTGRIPFSAVNSYPVARPASVGDYLVDRFPNLLMKYYPDHLRHMTACVEIVKLPLHDQGPKIEAWDQSTRASDNRVLTAMAPTLSKVYASECRSQAHLRAAATAVAAERYRMARGRWPASLEDLVAGKWLDAVPFDPIDGKPLRVRRAGGEFFFYSVGNDGVDDGGRIDRGKIRGVDVGFRLWDVAARRAGEK